MSDFASGTIPDPASRPAPDPLSDPAVRVHDLTRRFGDFTAVDAVSFEVAPGEIFGFLGPNGAGKTTTIRMLTGLLAPSAGSATVAGHDVVADRDTLRRSIGYMSQRFSLYPDLTAVENIDLFAGLYGLTGDHLRARRSWILEMSELQDGGDRLTADLPLGFKQRLALGCALVHEPSILFLDEPTSGVDPMARRRFWDLIDGLSTAGTTVFVSTHYMEEAEYCHRLALMNRGRLIALDTPAALRRADGGTVLEVAVDRAPEAVALLDGSEGVEDATLFGRKLHISVADAERGRAVVAARLAAGGFSVESMRAVVPSLEDVFVSLVQREGGAPVE